MKLPEYTGVKDFFPARKQMLTWSPKNVAILWNLGDSPAKVLELPHNGTMRNTRFTPDGGYLVTAGLRVARIWDAQTGKSVCEIQHGKFSQDEIRLAEVLPESQCVMTYMDSSWPGQPSSVGMWTLTTGEPLLELKLPVQVRDWDFAAFLGERSRTLLTWHGELAQLWEVPKLLPDDESLVLAFMKVRTGYQPTSSGAIERLSHEDWLAERRLLSTKAGGKYPDW